MIVSSMEEYEALAVKLALEPGSLMAVRNKLADSRDTAPLFDTKRFTCHLEAAYITMWQRAQKKQSPASFAVELAG